MVTADWKLRVDKLLLTPDNVLRAEFVCPGHPLLDAIDLILEQNRSLLKQGAVLVDERIPANTVHGLLMDDEIRDGGMTAAGNQRAVSRA